MDKRFLLFIALSFGIIVTWSVARVKFGPPPKPVAANPNEANQDGTAAEQDAAQAGTPQGENQASGKGSEPSAGEPGGGEPGVKDPANAKPESGVQDPAISAKDPNAPATTGTDAATAESKADENDGKIKTTVAPARWASLGSVDAASGYRMLVTFSSRGAAVERVELSSERYHDLEHPHGYVGDLALTALADGGCRVGVVGGGTPAARAACVEDPSQVGLRVGDELLQFHGQPVTSPSAFHSILENSRVGEILELLLRRDGKEWTYKLTTAQKPMEVIHPEAESKGGLSLGSYTLTLDSIESAGKAVVVPNGANEIPNLPPLRTSHWELAQADESQVEFRYRIGERDMEKINKPGALEVRKRFRLEPVDAQATDIRGAGYHLTMEVEIVSLGEKPLRVAYRLDGPQGLPLEGWWYATKISPGWGGAGARDLVWRTNRGSYQLMSAAALHKEVTGKKQGRSSQLFAEEAKSDARTIRFMGIDTQYFSSILLPKTAEDAVFQRGLATAASDPEELEKALNKKLNISFQVISEPKTITADASMRQDFTIFTGPKEPAVLATYDVGELIEYGWWWPVSKLLGAILKSFYWLIGNYGISIVLLTIVVRTCMLPISFKMTKNAQRMQALAPEMKIISEKYKNDLEKKNRAVQELWKKHNVNPLSGCLLVFFQLPVFAGLYRLLATDITLRQSPLISGMQWCSNLSGPDELCRWPAVLPAFLTSETGWLGPYLNILPLVTIALFIMNQRLLTPPPTDEQQQMQQKMMTFMMLFFAVMFFKVPSGLCLYFIASSIWTLAEHKVLKKNKLAPAAALATTARGK
ncbi:MAG: hypothetical protein RIS70_413 [Planctomycetota bacterium]